VSNALLQAGQGGKSEALRQWIFADPLKYPTLQGDAPFMEFSERQRVSGCRSCNAVSG
jgi:hypothetical protein